MNSIKKRGFTIIELLVVIAIISVLASIVLVGVNSIRDKAKVARAKADLKQLVTAVQMYYITNGSYPCVGHWYQSPGAGGTPGSSGDPTPCLSAALAPYMSSFPPADPWGSYYVWHLHPGSCECTSFDSMGPDKTYGGYGPCPPCHCEAQAGSDDLIGLVSRDCQ